MRDDLTVYLQRKLLNLCISYHKSHTLWKTLLRSLKVALIISNLRENESHRETGCVVLHKMAYLG